MISRCCACDLRRLGQPRERLRGGDPSLRQYYVRALVDRVEVCETKVRIIGSRKAIEHAIGRINSTSSAGVPNLERNGAPGWIRTSGLKIRSLVLYPAELRARGGWR